MKIFVSSVMSGFEAYRAAAFEAIEMLGNETISAESFSSTTSSSRIACLDGVRRADLVILILGASYGWSQTSSGLSPTHEEYEEAKDKGKVIAFIQTGVSHEPKQGEFIREVQDWDHGVFRGQEFSTPEQLRALVIQALHQHALAQASQPVSVEELLSTADSLMPQPQRGYSHSGATLFQLAIAGGPAQAILRPTQLEDPALKKWLFGQLTQSEAGYFDYRQGTNDVIEGSALVLSQDSGAALLIDERGSVRLSIPVERGEGAFGELIEENVVAAIARGLTFASMCLDHVDETHRMIRIAIAADLETNDFASWRTREENERSMNSAMMGMGRSPDRDLPVHLQPVDRPRSALRSDAGRLGDDLLTLLRRKFRR